MFTQPNARIHAVAAACALSLGAGFDITKGEWLALVLAITLVVGAEALNTAVELTIDIASPEVRPLARDAKDVAAAAVLLCSIASAIVGAMIFAPRLWQILSS